MRVDDAKTKDCCEAIAALTSQASARQRYYHTSHVTRHVTTYSPICSLLRIVLAAAGLPLANDVKSFDAAAVVVDALIASASFTMFSFWSIVAIAIAALVNRESPLQSVIANAMGGLPLTLEEVQIDFLTLLCDT